MVIQWLKSWISIVVSIVLLTTFIEIVLPHSQMRKYIQFIIGMVIIFSILSPLIKLLGQEDALLSGVNSIAFDIQRSDLKQTQSFIQEQQARSALELYKKRLQQSIQQQIDAMGYGAVIEVKVAVDEDQGSRAFGSIKNIEVYMGQEQEKESNIQPVEPVNVDLSDKNEKSHQVVSAVDTKAQAIKKQLASYYQIKPDDISIYRK